MSARKVPLTLSEWARKLADAQRLMFNDVTDLRDQLSEIRDVCEEYTARDTGEAFETLTEAIEKLTDLSENNIGLASDQLEDASTTLDELQQTLPAGDEIQALMDAYDHLQETLDEVGTHRDDPSSASKEEKADAREEVRSALHAVADVLDELAPEVVPPPPPPAPAPAGLDLRRLIAAANAVAVLPGSGATSRAVFCHAVAEVLTYQLEGAVADGLMRQIVGEYQRLGREAGERGADTGDAGQPGQTPGA